MGSYMGQGYIQKYSNHISKVVLCGSGCKNPAVPLGYVLAKIIVNKKNAGEKAKFLNKLMFGNFSKIIKQPKTEYDWLSTKKTSQNISLIHYVDLVQEIDSVSNS